MGEYSNGLYRCFIPHNYVHIVGPQAKKPKTDTAPIVSKGSADKNDNKKKKPDPFADSSEEDDDTDDDLPIKKYVTIARSSSKVGIYCSSLDTIIHQINRFQSD